MVNHGLRSVRTANPKCSNATFRATNVDDLFYLTVFSAPFCSLDPTDDFEHLKNLNRASKATAGSKGKPEVELMKIECRNWYTARAIACSINSSTFVVNSGASKFSRRRIDLSRQVANKMATRRSVDYSNEYGMHERTPRPGALLQAAWFQRQFLGLGEGQTQTTVCSLHHAKQLDGTHLGHPRQQFDLQINIQETLTISYESGRIHLKLTAVAKNAKSELIDSASIGATKCQYSGLSLYSVHNIISATTWATAYEHDQTPFLDSISWSQPVYQKWTYLSNTHEKLRKISTNMTPFMDPHVLNATQLMLAEADESCHIILSLQKSQWQQP
uniref:Bm8579 n=1 Tax=Brugia malayi TaxID=6279 RepID=A0A0J9XMS9_BRUMA|nr:Bm8579 [Brugia malayi]